MGRNWLSQAFLIELCTKFLLTPVYSSEIHVCFDLVFKGFRNPLALESINHSHALIAEHFGLIYLVDLEKRTREVFLNLTDRMKRPKTSYDERGLLGLALPQNLSYLYVSYSAESNDTTAFDHIGVVSRFSITKVNKKIEIDVTSEDRLLIVPQPTERNNGGQLFFAPDQLSLFVTIGDGMVNDTTKFKNSSYLGKILRLGCLQQNGLRLANCTSIYASGFRNPWRCTIDSGHPTCVSKDPFRIFCGDVGVHPTDEEILLVEENGIYGWKHDLHESPCRNNGTILPWEQCRQRIITDPDSFPNYKLPIHSYGQQDGQAVIGGVVSWSEKLPSLQGAYLFGDYVQGSLHALKKSNTAWTASNLVLCPEYRNVPPHVLAFGKDHKGDVYILATSSLNALEDGLVLNLYESRDITDSSNYLADEWTLVCLCLCSSLLAAI